MERVCGVDVVAVLRVGLLECFLWGCLLVWLS